MDRRQLTGAIAALVLAGANASARSGLTEVDAVAGVRAALERGARAAVSRLGRRDGFLGNPKVRIPLPGTLDNAAQLLKTGGQRRSVDELVIAMNRAAEAAVPMAKRLLLQAARSMSVEDAIRIVRGSDTSATEFFAAKTRGPLTEQFLPIVSRATGRVALADKYNAVAGRATPIGLPRSQDADFERYVTGRALDGLYLMIAEEERSIRRDPTGAGSAILRSVFGR